jgi:tetratricopeptide (TPR) repeat protein
MKRLALFAILSTFFSFGISRAQQISDEGFHSAADRSPLQTPNPPMTPRQNAEMRAQILMARKDYNEAAIAFQHILEIDPRDTDVLNRTGMAYQQLGESHLAEHFYKQALRVDNKFPVALNNLGTIEYSRTRYGKAIKYYKRAISAAPEMAAAYSNLGYAYCGIKQFPAAIGAFDKALALDPTIFEHKGSSGSVLQQRSAVDPGVLNFMLAKSYAKVGDAERAARYLKLARDDGYKNFLAAEKDPDFASVIKDARVQEVLRLHPAYADRQAEPVSN